MTLSAEQDMGWNCVLGAYDPMSSSIRLSYDPPVQQNVCDDPAFVHELAHYGQTILTNLGNFHATLAHELYYAGYHILKTTNEFTLPLSATPAPLRTLDIWKHADFVFRCLSNVIGGQDTQQLQVFRQAVEDGGSGLAPDGTCRTLIRQSGSRASREA